MVGNGESGSRELLEHVLVPVAHRDDALATARALKPYRPERVTVLHVVGAIFEAAEAVDASAIAYRSRVGNRLQQFLALPRIGGEK